MRWIYLALGAGLYLAELYATLWRPNETISEYVWHLSPKEAVWLGLTVGIVIGHLFWQKR